MVCLGVGPEAQEVLGVTTVTGCSDASPEVRGALSPSLAACSWVLGSHWGESQGASLTCHPLPGKQAPP